ncbi:MAG: S9 family peptidase [Gemmatimonadales bacterium]|nr:S9 family peptidase [Gemmatimonadales bacterium]
MRRTAKFLFCLFLFLLPSSLLAAGITTTQLLDIQQVGNTDISPDGKWAAYTVRENRSLDDEAGSGWSRLWVIATGGGKPRPFLTGKVSVGSPKFSPDGRYIGFTMRRGDDAKTQVWVIPVDGGEAQAATQSKTGVGTWSWGHDATSIFFVEGGEIPAEEEKLKKKGWLPRYYEENLKDRILCRTPFTFGTESPESTDQATDEILVEGIAVWGLDVGPRGRFVAFGASERNLVDQRYMFQDIYLLDMETGQHHLVVDVPGKLGNYRISPDGKHLAWTAAASRSDHAVSSLYVAGIDGAEPKNLTGENFEGHIRHFSWQDKQTLLFHADEGVHTTLSLQSIRKKPEDRVLIFDGADHDLVIGLPASRSGLKTMVTVGHNGTTPRELYAWRGKGSPKRLTRHNEWLADVELGEQKIVRWAARDGLELEGILMLPVGMKGPAPLIVNVHGGPEAHERNGWLSRYASPGQAMCAKGYAVFFPNYRGSTGRGVEFAASAFRQPAGAEFDDIIDGVDYLIAEGIADENRVGVMGGSYGGYAANWLATYYSDRLAAGISFVGISNLVSKRFLTDIPFEDQYVHMGGPVRETWDLMRERSPIRYAEKSRTPLLILHGEGDPRVHPSQSQEMFRALKMAGHPSVRLIFYPGEGHGNRKRFGREDFVHRTMAWFDHYLTGDNPWDGPMPALDISKEMGLLEEN